MGIRLAVISVYGDSIPYWDDFGIGQILHKYQAGTLSIGHIFADANEHRLVFNRILSIGYFEANQDQWDQKIAMVVNSAIWALTGVILLKICIQHLRFPSVLAPATLIVLFWFLPISLVNIIWGVQTHTYTMLLFGVLGCWYTSAPLFSARWWGGVICLACAPLTLAGGTFASFSVLGISLLIAIKNRFQDRHSNVLMIACTITGVLGLWLILIQPGDSLPNSFQFEYAIVTFLKTLSWPLISQWWPSVIFAIPISLLLFQELFQKESMSRLARFTLALYLFLFLLAIAVAYARGQSGAAPARRYFDYLTLIPISSIMALVQIEFVKTTVLKKGALTSLFIIWVVILAAAIPSLRFSYAYTVQDNQSVKASHTQKLLSFLNTMDEKWLLNKGFRGVPYPDDEELVRMMENFNDADMLPYVLQTPKPIEFDFRWTPEQIEASPFIVNGTINVITGEHFVKPFEQNVFGSYKPRSLGVKATGTFESTEFHHNRDYIYVPVTGYYGYPGMSIKFVDAVSGEEFPMPESVANTRNAENWIYVSLKLKKGYYKLVAEDANDSLWFGFATPKSVGRWSYRVERLIANSMLVWLAGLVILLFSLRHSIFATFLNQPSLKTRPDES